MALIVVFHCVKRVRIRGYSGPHFAAFEYEEIRSISPYLSECGEIRTRITPNTGTFHANTFLSVEEATLHKK